MIDEENLVENLKYFGLEREESKFYLKLLRLRGAFSIGIITTDPDADRKWPYLKIIRKLENLGLITQTKRGICETVNPREAIIRIMQKREEDITFMKKHADEIINSLEELNRPTPDSSMSASFSIIQGRSNIYTRIGRMIIEATDVVYLVSTVEDIMRMYHTAIPSKIKECRQNGGWIRMLTDTKQDSMIRLIKKLEVNEIGLVESLPKGRIVVEKDKQMVMSGSSMTETTDLNDETDSAIYTNSLEVLNPQFSLCEHRWKNSKYRFD